MSGKTWTAVVVVLAGFAGGARTEEVPAGGGPPIVSLWERVCTFAGRLQGRFVGSCIKKGMTTEEVNRIVGDEPPKRSVGGFGGITIFHDKYSRLGLVVSFDNIDPCRKAPGKTFRVHRVEASSLFS
jgi:hypothetical protein